MTERPWYFDKQKKLYEKCPEDIVWNCETPELRERAVRWLNHHMDSHGWYSGAAGGRFTYEITPTAIGTCYGIRCGACSDAINLSDYESW